jgi:hypothetical protein
MMMNVRLISTFLFAFFVLSCGPSPKKQASKKIQEALALRDSGKFNQAKLKLDTLIDRYGDLTEEVADAMRLLDAIRLNEQQRNVEYLDSMILVKTKELKPLLKNFIESDEYGPHTILIHKRQRPENSYNRTFVKAYLNKEGEFYISSRYYGTSWIKHHQIKVYYNGKSVTSEVIPEDGINNRQFEDGGNKWEIVNYKDGADNGIINFIASNVNRPLKVQFIGKDYFYNVMEKFDKEAIRDGYEISFVLKELAGLRKSKKKVEQEIKSLRKTIEANNVQMDSVYQ